MKTQELFTFELDLSAGGRMTDGTAEDIIYNCLDFCLLCRKTPHFLFAGADEARVSSLWSMLDMLRGEKATFSVLSEPEQTEYKRLRAQTPDSSRITVGANGEAWYNGRLLGNATEDRLADMWALQGQNTTPEEKTDE